MKRAGLLLVGRQAIGGAFAAALPIDVVSAALDSSEGR
jgi:hypothetical protein